MLLAAALVGAPLDTVAAAGIPCLYVRLADGIGHMKIGMSVDEIRSRGYPIDWNSAPGKLRVIARGGDHDFEYDVTLAGDAPRHVARIDYVTRSDSDCFGGEGGWRLAASVRPEQFSVAFGGCFPDACREGPPQAGRSCAQCDGAEFEWDGSHGLRRLSVFPRSGHWNYPRVFGYVLPGRSVLDWWSEPRVGMDLTHVVSREREQGPNSRVCLGELAQMWTECWMHANTSPVVVFNRLHGCTTRAEGIELIVSCADGVEFRFGSDEWQLRRVEVVRPRK